MRKSSLQGRCRTVVLPFEFYKSTPAFRIALHFSDDSTNIGFAPVVVEKSQAISSTDVGALSITTQGFLLDVVRSCDAAQVL